jgi:hypothetical protein
MRKLPTFLRSMTLGRSELTASHLRGRRVSVGAMKITRPHQRESAEGYLDGQLLIALPVMSDRALRAR